MTLKELYGSDLDKLTKKQRKFFEMILKVWTRRGFPPTYREMATQMGYASFSAPHGHLTSLVKKGFIDKNGIGFREFTLRGVKWNPVRDGSCA